jgi:hypothetical protein
MEQHVKQFGDTRKEQRAKATAKERDLLKQEITPALMAHFVSPEAKRNRSSAGGVKYKVPVNNGISSEEAMRFGLDSNNPGYKMMRDMGHGLERRTNRKTKWRYCNCTHREIYWWPDARRIDLV